LPSLEAEYAASEALRPMIPDLPRLPGTGVEIRMVPPCRAAFRKRPLSGKATWMNNALDFNLRNADYTLM
jgi:hypothetical protein